MIEHHLATDLSSMTTIPQTPADSGLKLNAPRSRPAYPPSTEDWNNHRDVFTQLYRVEGRTLKDTKMIMERLYDFRATVKGQALRFRLFSSAASQQNSNEFDVIVAVRVMSRHRAATVRLKKVLHPLRRRMRPYRFLSSGPNQRPENVTHIMLGAKHLLSTVCRIFHETQAKYEMLARVSELTLALKENLSNLEAATIEPDTSIDSTCFLPWSGRNNTMKRTISFDSEWDRDGATNQDKFNKRLIIANSR
ncbi:MAG: hypothetical protein Q9227_007863 [Pyrenula ochraceoflavens]